MNNLACAGQRIDLPPGRYKAALHRRVVRERQQPRPTGAQLPRRPGRSRPRADRLVPGAEVRRAGGLRGRLPLRLLVAARQGGPRGGAHTRIFLQTVRLDEGKTLESLTLPYNRRMHVFSMTLEAAAWTDGQRDQANASAEAYAALGRRQPALAGENRPQGRCARQGTGCARRHARPLRPPVSAGSAPRFPTTSST